jgi:hypothetical protein
MILLRFQGPLLANCFEYLNTFDSAYDSAFSPDVKSIGTYFVPFGKSFSGAPFTRIKVGAPGCAAKIVSEGAGGR